MYTELACDSGGREPAWHAQDPELSLSTPHLEMVIYKYDLFYKKV